MKKLPDLLLFKQFRYKVRREFYISNGEDLDRLERCASLDLRKPQALLFISIQYLVKSVPGHRYVYDDFHIDNPIWVHPGAPYPLARKRPADRRGGAVDGMTGESTQ